MRNFFIDFSELQPTKTIPAPAELCRKIGFPLEVGRTAETTLSSELSGRPFINILRRDKNNNVLPELLHDRGEELRRGLILANLAKASGIPGLQIGGDVIYFPSDEAFERFCRSVLSLSDEDLLARSQREEIAQQLGKPQNNPE